MGPREGGDDLRALARMVPRRLPGRLALRTEARRYERLRALERRGRPQRSQRFSSRSATPAFTSSSCCGSARRLDYGDWLIDWGRGGESAETNPGGAGALALSL